jgi:peptide/nickel transport system permease protein
MKLKPGWKFLLRRTGLAFASLLAVSLIIFWATQVLPGDAAQAVLGRTATPQRLQALREQMGLDAPVWMQYFHWLSGFLKGNLGHSLVNTQSVGAIVGPRILNSLTLVLLTSIIAIPLAFICGAIAADRRDTAFDNVLSSFSLALAAVPEFVVAIAVVVVFATVVFHWFPPVSMIPPGSSVLGRPAILVLPTFSLVLVVFPYMFRMVRASVIEALASEYVEMARLKGMDRRKILYRHALLNALSPGIQAAALTLGYLAGGVVLVEVVFAFPGMGDGLFNAISTRDIPVVQVMVLFLAAFYIVVNLIADILAILATPKLRTKVWPSQ